MWLVISGKISLKDAILTSRIRHTHTHTCMLQSPSSDKINSSKAAQFPGKWHATNKISPWSLPSGVTDLELTTVIIEWRSCRKKTHACTYVHTQLFFYLSHMHICVFTVDKETRFDYIFLFRKITTCCRVQDTQTHARLMWSLRWCVI